MSVSKTTAIVMFSGTLFLSAITQAQTSSSPIGNWQVTKVSINNQAQRTLEYQLDDDRLVGRFVKVSPASIVADLPGGVNCQSPAFSQHDKKMNDWITDVFGQGDDASAENYRLGIADTENAKISTVECNTGAFTTGDSDHNADFVFVENKVFLNWTDGTLLTLMPADENAKPVASFNCDKAESNAEKAICGNRTLASLDTSVSRSYSWYRKEAARLDNRELQTKLVTQQKEWLKQRNACTSDATCLQKSMQNRLESLSHSLDAF